MAGALLFRAASLVAPALRENFVRFRAALERFDPMVSHHPVVGRLELSRACDLRCRMCPLGDDPYRADRDGPAFLSLETTRLLDPILPSLLRIIAFGIGEPFLNPEALAILRHIRSLNRHTHVFISTNGRRFTSRLADAIVDEHLLQELQFSIDGANAATYASIRRDSCYADVIRNFEYLLKERERRGNRALWVKTEMLVMPQTCDQIFDFVRDMADRGVDAVVLDSPKGAAFRNLRVDDDESMVRICEQVECAYAFLQDTDTILDGPLPIEIRAWHRARGRPGVLPQWEAYDPCAIWKRPDSGRSQAPCCIPWENCYLTTDGDLRVCYNSERRLGAANVEVWRGSDAYQAIRSQLTGGDYNHDCGNCIAALIARPENLVTPPNYLAACIPRSPEEISVLHSEGQELKLQRSPASEVIEGWIESVEPLSGDEAARKIEGWIAFEPGVVSVGDSSLAICLNSRIQGFASLTLITPGSARFCARLESGELDRWPEDLTLAVLRGGRTGGPVYPVKLLSPHPAPWRVSRETDIDGAIMRRKGETFGFVDEAAVLNDRIVVRGWARIRQTGQPAFALMLFVDGCPVRLARPFLERLDVQRAWGGTDAGCGFSFQSPAGILRHSGARVEVLALRDPSVGSLLEWHPRGIAEDAAETRSEGEWELQACPPDHLGAIVRLSRRLVAAS